MNMASGKTNLVLTVDTEMEGNIPVLFIDFCLIPFSTLLIIVYLMLGGTFKENVG